MRKLALLTFVTLDGVMQSPTSSEEDPSDGFTQGGWAAPYWEEVMGQVVEEAMAEPYDLLLGRTTYDLFAPNWSDQEDTSIPAQRLNRGTKYVVTSRDDYDASWQPARIISGDVVAAVTALKAGPGPLLQVHGSQRLIQTLLDADLVDEFRLWRFPVVLGSGRKLFERPLNGRLNLTKQRATSQGVVMTFYER